MMDRKTLAGFLLGVGLVAGVITLQKFQSLDSKISSLTYKLESVIRALPVSQTTEIPPVRVVVVGEAS